MLLASHFFPSYLPQTFPDVASVQLTVVGAVPVPVPKWWYFTIVVGPKSFQTGGENPTSKSSSLKFLYFTIGLSGLSTKSKSWVFSSHGCHEKKRRRLRRSFQLRGNRISHGGVVTAMAAGAAWQRCLRLIPAAGLSDWDITARRGSFLEDLIHNW